MLQIETVSWIVWLGMFSAAAERLPSAQANVPAQIRD